MKILFLGDIVGKSGCNAINKNLKNCVDKKKIDFVIVNGENAADQGVGITEKISNDFLKLLKTSSSTSNPHKFLDHAIFKPFKFRL